MECEHCQPLGAEGLKFDLPEKNNMAENDINNPGSSALGIPRLIPVGGETETTATGRVTPPNPAGGGSAYEPIPTCPNPFGPPSDAQTGLLPRLVPVGESALPEEK
jgi:hypothetical protein